MDVILLVLSFSVAFGLGTLLGIYLGITDCKRVFGIPKHATGVTNNGKFTYY